ncbi:MAG TPA: fumarylacetoacetase [Gammaproteobacteria bacterium]|mgnify:CR=1 FL=1|nr:fumarylacetoacetase [Gammaproteobacteria bacterium]MEC8009587.1 fumarylacetoacetase [Pseudomonadota bacterium]HBF08026.1 fumarylacetoacetase [Gammaproteobacteria bacterium]HCK93519.1 fumarylacetoacetase [Gammaproteobacteria bacterium]|tara:strand:+ start:22649 stop:23881 length:1233 start_codon:yes stop_codon:yes gene_type:complete
MILEQLNIEAREGFDINNLPFGVFSNGTAHKAIGVAIGNKVLNLSYLEEQQLLSITAGKVFNTTTLNAFAAQGPLVRQRVRAQIQSLLSSPESRLLNVEHVQKALIDRDSVSMHYPFDTRGYTDFYSCENHARNVGSLFRDPENALNPNWKQLPVAYHGRTSTLVASHMDIKRPQGQILNMQTKQPEFSACKKFDFEIEMGMFVGQENTLFEPIPVAKAREHLFGFTIVNDWSARDIQAWEYVPLGPFLGKNFLTSVSPWVVTPEALESFEQDMQQQEPVPVEYLQQEKRKTYSICIEAILTTASGHTEVISTTSYTHQHWSQEQQFAHHTINGCKMNTGDLLATGTLSGTAENSLGCLLEMTQNGKKPIALSNGETRTFLQDGDTLTLSAYAKNKDTTISFGSISGTIT